MIRIAELCAGYGGLFLGLRQAGMPVELAWYAEVDSDASSVMAAHHPGVPNVGDITAAQFTAQEPVDVLAAGFPCQAVSGAGRQRGSADARWLWPDVARAIRVLRPELFMGENVARLLTIEDGRLFGSILTDLDQMGYTVRWVTIGACRVGLAHHRHRVFIVATRDKLAEPGCWPAARRTSGGWETVADTLFGAGDYPVWPSAGIVSGGTVRAEHIPVCGVADGVMLPTPTATPYGNNQSPSPGAAVRPSLEGVVQMLPTPAARLGDGRGDPSPELAGARLDSGRRNLEDAVATLLPTPTAVHHARNATANRRAPRETTCTTSWTLADVAHADRWGVYGAAIARHEQVTGVAAPEPTEPGRNGPRLAPRFVEWLMGLTAGHVTDHLGRSGALRALGNGVVPLQAAAASSLLLPAREVAR